IPADAAHAAGAQVLANLLLDPRIQAIKADPRVLGSPTVLDPAKLGARKAEFDLAAPGNPYVLSAFGAPVTEFSADRVGPLDARWMREVLRER
ncbi:MAG: ABC transporter substrate-binding protein, partial [Actinobacteria bacterium]|nr:ABC transporter substrate-binding protein [Actinomycetota bacterium]